jgi:hypothetical protein
MSGLALPSFHLQYAIVEAVASSEELDKQLIIITRLSRSPSHAQELLLHTQLSYLRLSTCSRASNERNPF